MNLKTIFIITLFLLLTVGIFSIHSDQTFTGKLTNIQYKNKLIIVNIENQKTDFIIFTDKLLGIKTNDNLEISGKEDTYKNNKQIIINKITKIN